MWVSKYGKILITNVFPPTRDKTFVMSVRTSRANNVLLRYCVVIFVLLVIIYIAVEIIIFVRFHFDVLL